MNKFIADFHVHTALSPCCSDFMTPKAIVGAAKATGINILAISDHNAGDNVDVTEKLAIAAGIKLFYSLELHVQESFHVLTLFEDRRSYGTWLTIVEQRRSKQPLEKDYGREQLVLGADDEITARVIERLNVNSSITAYEAIGTVHELGGVCIASHIDRRYDSVLAAYSGDIPPDLAFDALEISSETYMADALVKYRGLRKRYPFVTNSDSHISEEFVRGPKNIFFIEQPTLREIVLALNDVAGRSIEFKNRKW